MGLLKIYLRVLALLGPEKWLAIALALANAALAAVFLLEPWLFGRVVDALAAQAGTDAWYFILWWAAVGFFGVAASVLVALQADRLAHRRKLAAIIDFFEHALALPLAFHDRHHTGRLLRTLHSGSGNLFHVWLSFFRNHLSTLIALLVMVPLALRINWKLALLMLLLMLSFVLFNTIVARRTGKAQRAVESLNQNISERAGDVFGNVMVVQSFSRVLSEVGALRQLAGQVLAAQYPVLHGWAWASVANRAASTLTVIGLFALGVRLHAQGEISVGAIVSFVGFALMMIGRMEQLAGFISDMFFQAPALANFFEILDTRIGLHELPGAPELHAVRGAVAFEHVWFGYDPARPVLRDLSFRVSAGSTVAIVGPTGAGKTTALSLIYRAYDPGAQGRATGRAGPLRGAGEAGWRVRRARCAGTIRPRRAARNAAGCPRGATGHCVQGLCLTACCHGIDGPCVSRSCRGRSGTRPRDAAAATAEARAGARAAAWRRAGRI